MTTYLSVCSGIEAATVAWHDLGWQPVGFAEIEPFPSAVLAHHYPDVPNHGDMMALPARILSQEIGAPDILCGGTPCQAFSVAGLRQSLSDDRGNLSLTFCEIANAIDTIRARRGESAGIVFWENVPGVLNTSDNAFGCFLGHLPEKMVHWSRQGEGGRTLVVCLDHKEQSRGACSTPNISEWPNAAAVCSLSQVLETGSIPQRFFLSSTACAGILRRAEKRGKKLPPALQTALLSVAQATSE